MSMPTSRTSERPRAASCNALASASQEAQPCAVNSSTVGCPRVWASTCPLERSAGWVPEGPTGAVEVPHAITARTARPAAEPISSSARNCASSHPVRADAFAGGQPLGERRHHLGGAPENVAEPSQGEPVDDLLAPSLGGHEPAVAQAGQVRADAGLRLSHRGHELTDRALSGLQLLQDAEPGGIAEDAEEAGGRHPVDSKRGARYHIREAGYQTLLLRRE